jgi:predicted nucleotidyltransferase component of viral defense system
VISKKLVDRYAHHSGVKDQLVAEREVVLTYALGLLRQAGALEFLAFKGGTCLRKIIFGSTGRFSEDLDFTLRTDDDQEALTALYAAFNSEHHGIRFSLDDDWYETEDGFGMEVRYQHPWNSSGKFRLQVSAREKPTLAVLERQMVEQVYFKDLEFEPFTVPTLEPIEMTAEKVRAAFQRTKVRDLYDLYLLAKPSLQGEVLRGLVVVKLWQVGDAFDATGFFDKVHRADHDWADLRRLVRSADRVEPAAVIDAIDHHFRALRDMTELELKLIGDAKKGAHNLALAEHLREEVRRRSASSIQGR